MYKGIPNTQVAYCNIRLLMWVEFSCIMFLILDLISYCILCMKKYRKAIFIPLKLLFLLVLTKCRAMPRNLGSQRDDRDNK